MIKKIAVLLSGGVDSSVALALLKEKYADTEVKITAYYLKVWLQDEFTSLGDCPWEEDIEYAQQVCKQLEVPLEIVSLQKEYWDYVVTYAIKEIKEGRTPNPDVFCNSMIKFGSFIDYLNSCDGGFDLVASGHYARIEKGCLKLTKDKIKDQTYFLSYLSPEQLKKCCFPLGEQNIMKGEVRTLAKKFDLPTQDRKDSQGVCFLGKIKFRDFIEFHLGTREGDICDEDGGAVLGSHQGYWFYTLGQRQGLNLSGGPWYVVGKDVEKNVVVVQHADKRPTERTELIVEVENFNLLVEREGAESVSKEINRDFLKGRVKVRHGSTTYSYEVIDWKCDSGGSADKKNIINLVVKVVCDDQVDMGIAPGQFAVFYKEDLCWGSGPIKSLS